MPVTHADQQDRRSEERIEQQENISVKIVFSSENPGLLGKTLEGATIDVSASGLGIMINQPVKKDSVLDIWVHLKNQNRKFFLTGNARWCKETESGGVYQVGLVLRERTDTRTDLNSWQALFRKKS